jgi:hypothetical protein
MRSKLLVRVLIVLLTALLLYRIYDRVQSHRIPRDLCRSQMEALAVAEINYMYDNEGNIAQDLPTLLEYAGLPDSLAICPLYWAEGLTDSNYFYDPKLALGSQFAISCNYIERHGGVVGGFVEKEYPDSLFLEPDWSPTFRRMAYLEYATMQRTEASRANLTRVSEEEASFLGNRYPLVFRPVDLQTLGLNMDEMVDPLGGEYLYEIQPDTSYVFYQNPDRRGRARGDSVVVQTWKFVAWTTSDPDSSRVEVFYRRPLNLPSIAEGAGPGDNDMLVVNRVWDVSELGTPQTDMREVDLLGDPRWTILMQIRASAGSL